MEEGEEAIGVQIEVGDALHTTNGIMIVILEVGPRRAAGAGSVMSEIIEEIGTPKMPAGISVMIVIGSIETTSVASRMSVRPILQNQHHSLAKFHLLLLHRLPRPSALSSTEGLYPLTEQGNHHLCREHIVTDRHLQATWETITSHVKPDLPVHR